MKLKQLAEELNLRLVCGNLEQEYTGVYAGDLLSWVMSHARHGSIWITIMSNVNVIAVAALTEAACVIVAEGVQLSDDVYAVAEQKDVTVLSSNMPTYELCAAISKLEGNLR